ncbi:GIY-YIG nuclease family protein [Maribellus maritimus]|nr:GIY-YIG nuclease family protein [Maribellus maritimus]
MSGWAYITTNRNNRVLYTGVTGDLRSRMENHKKKKNQSGEPCKKAVVD